MDRYLDAAVEANRARRLKLRQASRDRVNEALDRGDVVNLGLTVRQIERRELDQSIADLLEHEPHGV